MGSPPTRMRGGFKSPTMESASRAKVNFSRLLTKCEEMISTPNSIDIKRFQKTQYLSVLKSEYTELQGYNKKGLLSSEITNQFGKRLDSLIQFDQQKKLPPTEQELQKQLFELPSSSSSSNTKMEEPRRLPSSSSLQSKMSKQKAKKEEEEEDIDEKEFDEMIIRNRQKQERITEDMVITARALKENNEHMYKIIKQGNQRLDELDDAMDNNLVKLNAENEKLNLYSAASCSSTLTYWILLVFVVVVFVFMYLFMKLVSKPIPST